MKILKTKEHFSNKELKEIMKSQILPRAFLDWQIIYAVQTNSGKQAEEFANILGVSKHKIYKVIQSYNRYGKKWRNYDNWGGRREERSNLSLEEEAKILGELEQDALSGKILIYKHLKEIVEKKTIAKFQMIIFGICSSGMVGKRRFLDKVIQKQVKKHKESIKKTQRKFGFQINRV